MHHDFNFYFYSVIVPFLYSFIGQQAGVGVSLVSYVEVGKQGSWLHRGFLVSMSV
jgi:hypothetical protein